MVVEIVYTDTVFVDFNLFAEEAVDLFILKFACDLDSDYSAETNGKCLTNRDHIHIAFADKFAVTIHISRPR